MSNSLRSSRRTRVVANVLLERVLGFTVTNNCSVAFDARTKTLFYTAGCVIVGESCENNKQTVIQSAARKTICCVDISPDGKYIITGESGHQPMVRIWCREAGGVGGGWGRLLGQLSAHHFRISAVRFSPASSGGSHIVSVGCQEDQMICVWDRAQLQKIASAKVSARVNAVSFSEDGKFFVTVGIRHVRFWYIDLKKRPKIKETQPLKGRNAVLGDMLHNTFTDVCCVQAEEESNSVGAPNSSINQTATLVLSQSGQLLQFSEARCIDKWVDLRTVTRRIEYLATVLTANQRHETGGAHCDCQFIIYRPLGYVGSEWKVLLRHAFEVSHAGCMTSSGRTVAVGCAAGVCLLFSATTLAFLARVPLPHPLGSDVGLLKYLPVSSSSSAGDCRSYPDVIAIKLDLTSGNLLCVYADHSLYCWDASNMRTMGRRFSHFYHSRSVCGCAVTSPGRVGMETASTSLLPDETDLGRWDSAPVGSAGSPACVERFATCSDDGTARLWSFPVNRSTFKANELFPDGQEEAHIIYTDPTFSSLCAEDRISNSFGATYFGQGPNTGGSTSNLSSAPCSPSPVRNYSGRWRSNTNIPAAAASLHQQSGGGDGIGIRSIAITPESNQIAVGDRIGQLRIYDLESFKLLHSIRAHDTEILSIAYFSSSTNQSVSSLLCTSSRDRVIHVFMPQQDYSLVQTLADHSGIINAARFVECEENGKVYLVSCGADRSLLFRTLVPDPATETARFVLDHHISGSHSYAGAVVVGPTAANLDVGVSAAAPRLRQYLAVACQDRQMRLFQVASRGARQVISYRASVSEDGVPICCAADPTSTLMATAGTDKQVNLFHLFSGEHVATLCGHADVVTGLLFLPDLRHLVSVSYDSCVFVWRLPPELTALMLQREHRIVAIKTAAATASASMSLSVQSSSSSPSAAPEPRVIPKARIDPMCESEPGNNFAFSEADLPSWARDKRSTATPDPSESQTPPHPPHQRPKPKRAMTTYISPNVLRLAAAHSQAATSKQRVSRSHSDRFKSSPKCQPQVAAKVSSRPADVAGAASSCSSSSAFPRWASSVVNLTANEAEAPFESPSSSDDVYIEKLDDDVFEATHYALRWPPFSIMGQKTLPKVSPSLSDVEVVSENILEHGKVENSFINGSGLDEDRRQNELCRVSEISCNDEAVKRKTQGYPTATAPATCPVSARASWLEPSSLMTTSLESAGRVTGGRSSLSRQSPALKEPRGFTSKPLQPSLPIQGSQAGQSDSSDDRDEVDVESLYEDKSATTDSPHDLGGTSTTLGLLSSIRESLDAVSHHFSQSPEAIDAEDIAAGRAFFRCELEWRLVRVKSLLQVETAVPAAADAPSDEKGMCELIERLVPRIRNAMANNDSIVLPAEGAVTSSSYHRHQQTDFLPAEGMPSCEM